MDKIDNSNKNIENEFKQNVRITPWSNPRLKRWRIKKRSSPDVLVIILYLCK